MKPKTMTRQQLYDLVWSMPMRDAAAAIPMSDVGLKKVCRRHQVPVPPQGYWNKLRAGHRVKKIKLPAPAEGSSEEVAIFAPPPLHGAALEAKQRAQAKLEAQEQQQEPEPPTVHECVKRTKRALDALNPDRRGALRLLDQPGVAQILVWPDRVERAMKLLNRLCFMAERAGHAVRCNQSGPAVLVVDGQNIGFEIMEIYSRREQRRQDDDSLKWRRMNLEEQYRYFIKEWVFVPSGKLRLCLYGARLGRQQKWADRIARPLEDQLPKVLSEAVAHAATMREEAAEAERRAVAREAEDRRREADRERRNLEEERKAFLVEKANAYDEAERLAAFVGQLHRKARHSRPPHLAAFLEWASGHVQSLRGACSIDRMEKDLSWSGLFK